MTNSSRCRVAVPRQYLVPGRSLPKAVQPPLIVNFWQASGLRLRLRLWYDYKVFIQASFFMCLCGPNGTGSNRTNMGMLARESFAV